MPQTGKPKKLRIDILLVKRGFFESRQKAQAEIMAGNVLIDETPIVKAGISVPEDSSIRVKSRLAYVGRGALKLIAALDHFSIPVDGRVGIDIGASTGGFTEVMLERGASMVYAIDVGTNQLAWKLRNDPRVIAMDHTNARNIDELTFDPQPGLATIDVSFISLTKILSPLMSVLASGYHIVALIKPQFELSPELISDHGFVKEGNRSLAIERVLTHAKEIGLEYTEVIESPIHGAKSGNVEFLTVFSASNE